MSASDVQREILDPMQRLFLPPRRLESDEEQAVLREYVRALEGFDSEILHLAWHDIVETHSNRSWPLPSACVKAAKDAKREHSHSLRGTGNVIGSDGGADKWALWLAVSRTELAREAVRRGVSWSLKCLVLGDGKRAEEIDIRALTLAKGSAEKTAEQIAGGKLQFRGDIASHALNLWRAQLNREAETQTEINYGHAA